MNLGKGTKSAKRRCAALLMGAHTALLKDESSWAGADLRAGIPRRLGAHFGGKDLAQPGPLCRGGGQ